MSSVQTWDPALYARHARFVSDLGSGVLELLAPQPGERILDLGCGDGVLTKKLVDLGCHVVAVDASAPQIEAARKLGLDAHVMDGEALPFRTEFDAVFSNAARAFFKGFRATRGQNISTRSAPYSSHSCATARESGLQITCAFDSARPRSTPLRGLNPQ